IRLLRENPNKVREAAASKNIQINTDEIVRLDAEYRELSSAIQELYAKRNQASKERDIEAGRELKDDISSKEGRLKELKDKLDALLYAIPNMPATDVKVGKSEEENDVVRTVGEVKNFSIKPLDHVELGQKLDIIDIDRAAKVSGARFAYLKNEGAMLEFALVR